MSFRFRSGESPADAIQRLVVERTRSARSRLKRAPDGDAVHEARRDLKRLKALLEWVRPAVRGRDLRRWLRAVDRCSHPLSDVRDAQVRLRSLSWVTTGPRDQVLPAGSWNRLARRLRQELSRHVRLAGRGRRIRRLRERLSGWLREFQARGPSAWDWQMAQAGLRASYRRARRGLARAQACSDSATRHRWRRHIQILSDQLAPLGPAAFPAMAAWASGLEALRACLGLDHDLWLLREFLRGPGRDTLPSGERDRLLRVLRVRRRKLAADALRLGRRLFLLRSSRFLPAFQRLGQARQAAFEDVDLTGDTWAGREPMTGPEPATLADGNGVRFPGPDEPIRRR